MMSTLLVANNYTRDLIAAVSDLNEMEHERNALETKIAKQKKRVAALHELAKDEPDSPAMESLVDGITDACRVVFRAFDKPLLPIEVRDKVMGLGIPNQNNLLASIYTTIRRMKQSGEIIEVFEPQPGSSTAVATYKWAGETIPNRIRRLVGDPGLPNPSGKNLSEMLKETPFAPKYGLPDPLNKRGKK